ncbi:hypothetical protein SCLCIDRAFT_1006665 [Scleroderma citrinum Foug A]|uniref:Uncharacterized protein n=1 Tax=Scleroderma citrinum Foug A TaxID=1036808 RepID=A0A0C3A3D6_9AGAM|nr:hypothetical protein SCLCIDRAFT_1006665 [Scleroderma citrinum Foug A]
MTVSSSCLASSECRGSASQSAACLTVQYLCARPMGIVGNGLQIIELRWRADEWPHTHYFPVDNCHVTVITRGQSLLWRRPFHLQRRSPSPQSGASRWTAWYEQTERSTPP